MLIDVLGPVWPWRGGIAHHTTRMAHALREEGHDVRLLNYSRLYPEALFPGTSQRDEDPRSAFRVNALPLVDSLDPRSWRRTVRAIRQRGTQRLVIAWWHPFFAPSLGAIAAGARRAGIDVTWICHNVLPHERKPWDGPLTRLALGQGTRWLVHAAVEADRLRTLLPRALATVHPHPVYDLFTPPAPLDRREARRTLGLPEDAPVALFFGLIRPYKGVDLLLEALDLLPDRDAPPWHTWIAGECYGGEDTLRARHARLRHPDRVHLELRYLANDEVALRMAAADVVVLPYRHATQSGIVQVAYACRRPVITTRVGGLPEVVDDGVSGLLVAPEDPGALAAALQRFAGQKLGPALEEGAARVVRRMQWDSYAREVARA
jgi:glycosyltransferase involved in cell wall biosynthesis